MIIHRCKELGIEERDSTIQRAIEIRFQNFDDFTEYYSSSQAQN